MRRSSTTTPALAINRQLDATTWDLLRRINGDLGDVETVADAIDDGTLSNMLNIINMQVVGGPVGSTVQWDGTTLTVPLGADGNDGADGDSVTVTSVYNNGDGTLTISFSDGTTHTTDDLRGPRGIQGVQGIQGVAGNDGTDGNDGHDGQSVTVTNVENKPGGKIEITFSDGTVHTTDDLRGNDGVDGLNVTVVGIANETDKSLTISFSDGTTHNTGSLQGSQGNTGKSVRNVTYRSSVDVSGNDLGAVGAGIGGNTDTWVMWSTPNADPGTEIGEYKIRNGNSAYTYAVQGGYTGTEAEWSADVAALAEAANNFGPLKDAAEHIGMHLDELDRVAAQMDSGTIYRETFTAANDGDTEFTMTNEYSLGFMDVFMNGKKLLIPDDVDCSDTTKIVLAVGAKAGDIIDTVSHGIFPYTVTDHYTKAEVDGLITGTYAPIDGDDHQTFKVADAVDNEDAVTLSQLLDRTQSEVPAGAVFTDTTYSIQDGELSEYNFTAARKDKLDNMNDMTDDEIFEAVKRKHGAGSGLDADLLDGHTSGYFAIANGHNSRKFAVHDATDDDQAVSLGQLNNKVQTDVPAGAVFTDTTYDDTDVIKDADFTSSGLMKTDGSGTYSVDGNTYLTAETDPVFTAHDAYNITADDIDHLSHLSGNNTGDQDLSNFVQKDTIQALTADADVFTINNNTITLKLGDGTEKSVTTTDHTYSVGDGGLTEKNFTGTLADKLDGIDANATRDMTANEILTALKTVDGAGSGLDADTVGGKSIAYFRVIDYLNITADHEAANNQFLKMDTSGGEITVKLPAGPEEDCRIDFLDATSSFGTNSMYLDGNGETVMGLNEVMEVDIQDYVFGMLYTNGDWRAV